MALGSIQRLAEMSMIISLEKGGRGSKNGRCMGLKSLLHSYADFLKNWEPQTPGILKAYKKINLCRDCLIQFMCIFGTLQCTEQITLNLYN
jgi:hypothetical protein